MVESLPVRQLLSKRLVILDSTRSHQPCAVPRGSTTLAGRSPDTADLPETIYQVPLAGYGYATGVTLSSSGGDAYLEADEQALIALSSSHYSPPAELKISGSLNVDTVGAPDAFPRGLGLGFFSAPATYGSGHGNSNFDGLLLESDGDLVLFSDGSSTSVSSTYDGTFDASAYHNLSYDYDSATGAITDVMFDGTSYSADFTGTDVQTGDGYAGFAVSSASGSGTGEFKDFEVDAVPEPRTEALFALGACLVLAKWLRLRRIA